MVIPRNPVFINVIHEWKAQHSYPDRLVALYKRVGAQYFFAMANHHDNLDLWDSKYQSWNSVMLGPKKHHGGLGGGRQSPGVTVWHQRPLRLRLD
jgi:hypothetical protein